MMEQDRERLKPESFNQNLHSSSLFLYENRFPKYYRRRKKNNFIKNIIILTLSFLGFLILFIIILNYIKTSSVSISDLIPKDENLTFTEEEHRLLSRKFATEGMVLAKNPGDILPILPTDQVVLFGEGTINTVYGSGSSAAVYQKGTRDEVVAVSILEGVENKFKEKKCFYNKNKIGYLIDKKNKKQKLTERDIKSFATLKKRNNKKIENKTISENIGAKKKNKIPRKLAGLVNIEKLIPNITNPITNNSAENNTNALSNISQPEILEPNRTVAVFSISRISWEGHDRNLSTDIKFTPSELDTYKTLQKYFDSIVLVLNVPSWMEIDEAILNDNKTSILIAFFPGIEAGNAISDVLFGDVNPSGHLTDTWAKTIQDYPTTKTFLESKEVVKYDEGIFVGYRYFEENETTREKIVFPFGHGLSYTKFEIKSTCMYDKSTRMFTVHSFVKNIGERKGKEVIQIYGEKQQNEKFVKAKRELVGFGKTEELDVNDEQELKIEFKLDLLASYDEEGITGNKGCFVVEKGIYNFYAGNSVADTRNPNTRIYSLEIDNLIITKIVSNRLQINPGAAANGNGFDNLLPSLNSSNSTSDTANDTSLNQSTSIPNENISMPEIRKLNSPNIDLENKNIRKLASSYSIPNTINFKTVLEGKYSMKDLIRTMSDEELAFLTYGHKSPEFITGSLGGFPANKTLQEYLIPLAETVDGPGGIRQDKNTMASVAWPCETLLASSFNEELLFEVGVETGKEARKYGAHIFLGPGLNIHRNPLCGRNFEYFSEDPLISGKMAAAVVKGVQTLRVSATIKHFAGYNREENRRGNLTEQILPYDSQMSERTAREIYLKGFEIAISEGKPWSLMTSYNRLNGLHASANQDLLTAILRNEWAYEGLVMTDWNVNTNLFEELSAGGNVKMPCNKDMKSYLITGGIKTGAFSRKQLEEGCLYILNTIAKTHAIDSLFEKEMKGNKNETK